MDDSRNQVTSDATPFILCNSSKETANQELDLIMDDLSEDDYRSVLFLLLQEEEIPNYLYLITKDKNRLKQDFLEKYHNHQFKESMLVEVLGVMQKYKLLTLFKTCQHVFKNEVENTNILDMFWKCLYTICEQLSDAQVTDLKRKLHIPASTPITCAEQLFCEAIRLQIFSRNNLSRLEEIFDQHYPKCYELLMTYKRSSKITYYPMTHPTTGHAVIFCHTNFKSGKDLPGLQPRIGSRKDAEDLKAVLEKFGFNAEIHWDKTDVEVKNIIQKISSSDHSSHDAFVVCYLSHGDEGVVYASNSISVRIDWMISTIANNCPSLIGKPKLFFIQACQGNQILNDVLNYSKKEPFERNEIDMPFSKSCEDTPIGSDVLLVLSTIEKFASYSCPGANSWFIGELIKALNEDGENLPMLSIITKVIRQVSQKQGIEWETHQKCKQIPVFKSTLRHELKFKSRR